MDTEGDHYKNFNSLFPRFHDYSPVLAAQGILKGAKSDFEDDYLFDTRALIQAEVFDDFLDQAKHLFDNRYHAPAAVIAGRMAFENYAYAMESHSQPNPNWTQ